MAAPVSSGEPMGLSDLYASARTIVDAADEEAARIRVEADRYARQRELEAELLVSKARRVLRAAEARAAAIEAAARATAPDPVTTRPSGPSRSSGPSPVTASAAIDLTILEADPEDGPADRPVAGVVQASGQLRAAPVLKAVPGSELDRILATAVSAAVDRALGDQ